MQARILSISAIALSLVVFRLSSCASAFAEPAAEPAAVQESRSAGHFPVPAEALVIPDSPSGELMLVDLLREFGRVTGQNLVMSDFARTQVATTRVGLLGEVTVPASEVYSFVEGVLRRHNFVMCELRHADPPLLGIYTAHSNDYPLAGWIEVDAEEVERYADHTALLVQTLVSVAPLPAREASASVRILLRDTSRQAVLAVSEHSMLIAGTGREVADMVSLLRKATLAERAALDAAETEKPESEDG